MSAHRQILVPTPDFICRHRELRIVLAPPEGVDADVAHQRPEEGGPLLEPLAAVGDDGRGHAVSTGWQAGVCMEQGSHDGECNGQSCEWGTANEAARQFCP